MIACRTHSNALLQRTHLYRSGKGGMRQYFVNKIFLGSATPFPLDKEIGTEIMLGETLINTILRQIHSSYGAVELE